MWAEPKGNTVSPPAARRDIIVIGASAGGLEALTRLVAGLPVDFPAAVFVVMHIPAHTRSMLPELLASAGPLPAAHAADREPIRPGRIYVAPPDRHLVLQEGAVRLSAGPRENHSRPAADPLFRSAAAAYGPRVIGVVLSGALSDGTAGLWEIKQHGGVAVVQDPGDAAYRSMPHAALDQVPVDHVLPAAQLSRLLVRLVSEGEDPEWAAAPPSQAAEEEQVMVAVERTLDPDDKPGAAVVRRDQTAQVAGQRDGNVAVYVCPECGGTLWQVDAGPVSRFRCHVGHIYGGEDLLEGYTTEVERTLWRAVRTLRDKANLTRQFAHRAQERGAAELAELCERKARLDDEQSAALEQMLAAASRNSTYEVEH
jgi:two-component system chemotaxis response regulator CheB